jgi:hypothetical protein
VKILFVHGLGATRFDFLMTARHLKKMGHDVRYFSYFASLHSLEQIRLRLQEDLTAMAAAGDYAVVGHSLGGVLLRDALLKMPVGVLQPKHLFLVGSPMAATKMNTFLSRFWIYQLLAGQCGQLVASEPAMAIIGVPDVATTCIVGSKGWYGKYSPFGDQPNDGIVLEAELQTEKYTDVVRIHARHPVLPMSSRLWPVIHGRLRQENDIKTLTPVTQT